MALTDHVIVLAHLRQQVMFAPRSVPWEDVLRKLGMGEELLAALPPAARRQPVGGEGEPVISHAALTFSRSGPDSIVSEVEWACSCRQSDGSPARLHVHHEFVLAAWATHVAVAEGIDPDHLMKHPIAEIDGRWRPDGKPRVVCLCGERFESDSWLPDLAAWERHVRAA